MKTSKCLDNFYHYIVKHNIFFIQQMKNLAQYKYRILRLDSDDAANMLYVNGRLIHRSRDEIGEKSYSVCIHKCILCI